MIVLEKKKPRTIPERGYAVGKTRGGSDKITLYERGRKILEKPTSSRTAAIMIGRAWGQSA